MDALHALSASELLALYRSGQLSPVAVTQAILDRIARLNPRLNAFCVIDPQAALASARSTACRCRSRT